jgi:hypothetical protein
VGLGGEVVDAVDHHVVLALHLVRRRGKWTREHVIGALRVVERALGLNLGLRVDEAQAVAQNPRLRFPHVAHQRLQLPVRVGDAHVVEVDQRQVANR